MQLLHEFTVPVAVEEAWALLTDIERIAPCMPGARLLEVDDGTYRGEVKVKVGPITSRYRGHAKFVERDDERRQAVLRAEGTDPKGQGNASALISAALFPTPAGTRVHVTTDLQITGKAVQFGRGVLNDVSAKLMDEFARSLEATITQGEGAPPVDAPPAVATGPVSRERDGSDAGTVRPPAPEARGAELHLLRTVAGPVLRRLAPVLAVAGAVWLVRRCGRRPAR